MKSNSDIRPAAIQPLGNGAFHYNYNITEVAVPSEAGQEGEETIEKTAYNYDTVKVWNEPTAESITRAVIREEIDETKEFGYVNDYNAAKEGIIEDEAEQERAVAAYKEYLRFVREVKAMVRADIEAYRNSND